MISFFFTVIPYVIQGLWVTDEVIVKIEKNPFDCGAMREVYRMKMIQRADWCFILL